jgi:4'-phosphopantetheinyl transferase
MWEFPPEDLNLSNNEVHVWRFNLDLPAEQVEKLVATLSVDEKVRGDRFRFEQDRKRFIVGRGILRTILSRYLSIEPKQLQFEYSPRGKPKLAENFSKTKLQFNLSHSQGLALYGLTKNREIGIDLEYLRPMPNALNIAQRFFSEREYRLISNLSPEEQQKTFFQVWTRKEAYLKATGDGLSGSLDSIEVLFTPGASIHILNIPGDTQVGEWCFYDLIPAPNFIAAVVVSSSSSLNLNLFYVSGLTQ